MDRFTRHEKIDVCRGLFAMLVVLAHALQIAWVVHPGVDARMPETLREALDAMFRTGTIYVMGFFVVSGYCIQLSVARSSTRGNSCLASMSPPALADLAAVLPGPAAGAGRRMGDRARPAGHLAARGPAGRDRAQVFLVQNLSQTYGSFAPSWSITNEVFYYLFYGARDARS